ncbi:MAG TPA: peptidyl-alpha-hydroxyglycine alpha-amidating lyase family protein [Dehalococcoidia bacterium]|nr:peptidyl-alpha-hydroxyglycine alpha-amidating lyase family protein [Dehalococcoidia bacterium]
MAITEEGIRKYELVKGWGQLPDGWAWGQVGAVCVDSEDNVHIFTRAEHPYVIFDKNGKMLDHWGEGIFEDAHGMCITPDDTVYFVDRQPQIVLKFNKQGRHRLTLGKRGVHSDTGYTREEREPAGPLASGGGMPVTNGVAYAGPPFYHPTDVSIGPNGEIYVSDGYRNARVHKYAPDGTLLMSWGEPGHARDLRDTKDGPGKFHTVHSVWEHKGKVYVADRENNRIQIFTPEGQFLDMWTGFLRPTKIYVDREDVMYVSELEDRFSIVDLEGNVLYRYGSERSNEPGKFWGPHGIWTDSEGSVYVAEVLNGQRLQKFARVK